MKPSDVSGSESWPPRHTGRVLAVVVAYNSQASIERCLAALDSQTVTLDVLVVDNSEPAPLEIEGLDLRIISRTEVFVPGRNLGPAGGFALGLAMFQESSAYDYAWLMDDDCYPDSDALELLLRVACNTRAGSVLTPSGLNENTGRVETYPGWSGVLIDRLAVRLAGLPRAELFWWAEDTEYLQYRLPLKGVELRPVPEARVTYDLPRRIGGRPAWKYYYEARNTVWYRLRIQRGLKLWKLLRSLLRLLVAASISSQRRKNLPMFTMGVGHGILGLLGDRVRPSGVEPLVGVGDE